MDKKLQRPVLKKRGQMTEYDRDKDKTRTDKKTGPQKDRVNPHQNDQGRKGPCFFQRLIALKCLKCQKI
jgi:hypothetical protein